MSDKRKHQRLQLALPLKVKKDGVPTKSLTTKLVDISLSGAKFYFNEDVSVGTKMEITIDDFDNILAGKFGLDKNSESPARYRLDVQVMRAEKMNQDLASHKVAVKFSRLLRYIPDDIYLN